MPKRELTITEFARKGGHATAALLGREGMSKRGKKGAAVRWKKYRAAQKLKKTA